MSAPKPGGTTLSTLGGALRASRLWVTAIVVVCVALGAGAGALAPRQYTAQAQLIAGAKSVSAASIPSFAEAGRTLAETYSRVFRADGVQQALVGRFGRAIASQASASPIPDSSVIIVEARGSTPDQAVDVANTGADALVRTVGDLLESDTVVDAAQTRLATAYADLDAARSAPGARGDSLTPDAMRSLARVQSSQARVDGLIAQLNKLISDSDQANGVVRLASAAMTASNATQRYEFGGLAGLVVGGVLGVGLAVLRARRRLDAPEDAADDTPEDVPAPPRVATGAPDDHPISDGVSARSRELVEVGVRSVNGHARNGVVTRAEGGTEGIDDGRDDDSVPDDDTAPDPSP